MVIHWFEHLLLPSLVLVRKRWKFERMKQGQRFAQHIARAVVAAVLFVAVQFLRLKPLGLLLLEMLQTVVAVVVETR
jgi:hypothetical protein